MYSKNNKYMQEQKSANRAQRFGLRKLSIGTVSVLLGTLMFFGNGQVSADTTTGTDTNAEATNVNSTVNDTSASAVTLSSTDSAAAGDANSSAAVSSAAVNAQTATVTATSANSQSVAATSTADSSQNASAASTAMNDVSLASSAATTVDSQTVSDDALTSKGEIVAKDKLSDSDVNPRMNNANGAIITADESRIPNGYKADPTEGRFTFGIMSLGPVTASDLTSYNQKYNTDYYIRLSVAKNGNNGVYDDTVYIQLVDADTDTVLWETTSVPGDTDKEVGYLNKTDGKAFTYTYSETTVAGVTSKGIIFSSNIGPMYSINVYNAASAAQNDQATSLVYNYPFASTLDTRYIAKDAAGNDVILATYDETGRIGYQYTASGVREFVGFDLTSLPTSTTGVLKRNYKVGDVYFSTSRNISDALQVARVQVITGEDGTVRIEFRVAKVGASVSDVNDPSIWKTIFSTEDLKPGGVSVTGNKSMTYNGIYYSNGGLTINQKELEKAGFTEDQLTGLNKYTTKWILVNPFTLGQNPVDYYYAPQGQVRINYVTSDGTAIQNPTTAYENSGNNTSYDVTGSNYRPETITVNGKTYRYVKADKSLGIAGTTTVNGFTYTTTPSDATGTINSNNVNDVYFVYEQVTYHTEADTPKTVTRTIEYYDSVTGEPIPSSLESTVTQTATLKRNKIYDDQNNFIGYGTISADGSSYTIDDSWKADAQTWTQQDSADLSDYGYTAPDRAFVAAVTVNGNTANVTVKIYYGHQTTLVTPTNPGTPGKPINPKGDVNYPDGVAKNDLTDTVTRTINYVDAKGNPVKGGPNGEETITQTVTFERTAIVDKVTGKILGYDIDNDGMVDTENADRAWIPLSAEFNEVKSAAPKSLGFDNVDKSTISTVTIVPGQADLKETVVYSNNPVVVSGTITYIDDTTGVTLDQDNLPSGEVGSKINYTTADKITDYEHQGYELVSNDFADGTQTYAKTGNNFVVRLKHKTQTITPNDPNPVTPGDPINPNDPNSPVYPTEADRKNLIKEATQTIHYVGAGDKTPADKIQTKEDAFTRTVTIDKVTGRVLLTSDWQGSETFGTENTPVVNGYHADKKTAGGLTATVADPNVEETVTYTPNAKIVPVDPNGNPIPGADTPTYPTDPTDPTKVVPNEPIPNVPGYTPIDPSPVTPADPGKDTPVPYTQNQYGLTEQFVDEDGNELLPSVSKGSSYKYGEAFDVTGDAKVINGYVLVKQDNTKGTFGNGDETAKFIYKKLGRIIPVDPNGNPIPGADTPIYQNDPNDPTKVVPNEPIPNVPGYTPIDPSPVTPADPGKDTPVPYTQNQYGLTEQFVDEDGNELLPSVSKGSSYKYGEAFDVTGDAKVINGYVLVKQDNTKGTFGNGDETAKFIYKKLGRIIPVDPNGNPIPGADTPIYQNDPNDPRKVVPNEPTPIVPGYTPNTPTVTPNDPTKDTPVTYIKNQIPIVPKVPTTPESPVTPNIPGELNHSTYSAAIENNTEIVSSHDKANNAKQLPQTGNDQHESILAMIGLALAGLGFGIVKPKKRKS